MARPERSWLMVCGGFHAIGGMDRLNASLARYLAARGARVHLVGHDIDETFDGTSGVTVTRVPRPAGSVLLGEVALARAARRIRTAMGDGVARPILLGNGGNAECADVNWVHSVHHAWPCADEGAPAWFRAKNRACKAWSKQRESRAIAGAAAIVANSLRTKQDLLAHLPKLDPHRIHVVYPGTAPEWRPPDAAARAHARSVWRCDPSRPLVVMVGALGHDVNKGVDVLLHTWQRLSQAGSWDAQLVVAGPGETTRWRALSRAVDVTFTGHINNVGTLLDAADLLVSPVRYEAYGLAVHEAICRGVPVLVSRTAGIAERFPSTLTDLLIDAGDTERLTSRLLAWRADMPAWARSIAPLGATLRGGSLDEMCAAIVGAAGSHPATAVA